MGKEQGREIQQRTIMGKGLGAEGSTVSVGMEGYGHSGKPREEHGRTWGCAGQKPGLCEALKAKKCVPLRIVGTHVEESG